MSTRIRFLLFAGIISSAAALGGIAQALAQEPVPVTREILALYDGAQEGDADLTRIHRIAELPLNHLGFVLRYHDIRAGLPEPSGLQRYRGVLTWFAGPVADSNGYLAWASQVSRMNVRYVILGDIGILPSPANILVVNRLLNLMGVRHSGDHIASTMGTRIVQKDPHLTEFECRVDPVLPDYPVIEAIGPGVRTGLTLETPSRDGKRKTVLVAIGERGGYAALNYEYCHQRSPLYQGKWLLNPFAFFCAAFGADNQPIPDTTTASGNRLYFSILDNEGWTRSSDIDRFRHVSSGEVVLRDLIEKFSDLPVTFYFPDKEARSSGRAGQPSKALLQRLSASTSVDQSQRSLRTTLSRFDAAYPSISNLAPLVGASADRRINMSMSDETYYNKAGTVGENAFSALAETISNTETPRRLSPVNLNYHAYVGQNAALLRTVRDRLFEARRATLAPVSANHYAAIVDGFFSARIDRVGVASWRIGNRGELQTIRFDDAGGRRVDIKSSVGVIGQKRIGTTLYVALDGAVEPATIVLGAPLSSEVLSPSSTAASMGFSLVESRWLVRRVVADEGALSFEAQGYGDGSFNWSQAAPGRYVIKVNRAGREIWRQLAADDAGNLQFVLPVNATDGVAISVNRISAARAAERQ